MRLARRDHGLQRLDVQHLARLRGCPARLSARARDHGEDGLADVAQLAVGQDRIVVQDRPAVVVAGDVGGREHVDDARHGTDPVQSHRAQAPVRDRRQAEGGVQRAGQLGDVVDVGGAAGHVQVGRLVRARRTDAGAGARLEKARRGAGHATLQIDVASVLQAASGRVSSQKRRNRFCATRSR
jgi:hypothetical protein